MTTRLVVLGLLFCTVTADAAVLSPFGSTWRFLRGTNEASLPDTAAWRGTNFNDASFADAPAPFWYGDPRAGGTQLSDMQNNYTCFFLRRSFVASNVADVSAIRMDYYIDDGFVMWINGVEVYREGLAAGDVTRTTLAANQPIDPAPDVTQNLFPVSGYLRNGTNWLTVQVFNTSAGSTDIGFDCSLTSLVSETNPPVITSISPPPNSTLTVLTQITVQFSEPMAGVSSDDLLVHGIGATSVTGGGAVYTFSFDQAPYGTVPITWETSHGITDQAVPPNPFDETKPGATWSYTLIDLVPPVMALRFPAPGATVRALGQIEITFSEPVAGANASDLLINGQPATNVIAQSAALYLFQFAQPAPGSVQVAWAGSHGIADLAVSPNAFAGGSWNYTLDPNANGSSLEITEMSAANQSGLADEDGEQQDWIEIRNSGSTSADLIGWSLSDDAGSPGQWVFPSRILLPGEYLVVFASGKDRRNPAPGNRFHTSFQLAAVGEFLGLFTPDSPRQLASGFAPEYPVQRNDYSYGRDPNGALRYFAAPTPGASNGFSTVTGVVEPVHFSTPRGQYTQPFTLVLSCSTPAAVIRITTDGSEPTAANGQFYTGPIRVTNTLFLRAVALRTNLLASQVRSHSYFFNLGVAERTLPLLSILTHSNNMLGTNGIIGMSGGTGPPNNPWTPLNAGDYYNPTKTGVAWERPMSVEYIRTNNTGFQIDCGMRVQGSDWTRPRYLATSKFSYRLYFRGDYGSGRLQYPWFPTAVVNSFDQIVLRAGHNDETNPYLTDELMRQLAADTGQAAVHGTFVNFFINGSFKRYYNPCERVEEGFLQSWHGGGSSWDILTVGSAVQGGDAVAWTSLRNYVNSQNVQTPSVYTEIGRRMDLTNFCDYLLVNTYGATWDWPQNNWRAARERAPTGLFRFYVWDAEGSFAQNGGGGRAPTGYDTFASDLIPGTAEIPVLYRGLRNSAEFRLLWADRVHKQFFNNGALGDSNITARYLQLKAQVAPAVSAAGLGFIDNILTSWIPNRRAALLNQYNSYGLLASSNAPFFSQHGGFVPPGYSLTMAATNGGGTIYYTTDGSDPRVMFTGAVSNSAIAYVGPLTLNQGVSIKARTLNGTNWSAVAEATFQVAVLGTPLRITEIHYNPPGGQHLEFIELQNVGSAPLDLSGVSLSGAVRFTFPIGSSAPAGSRLVLVSDDNPAAFLAFYTNVPIAGVYGDKLGNGGDTIVLKDRNGATITSVTYSDGGGWPVAADGGGRSLEVIDPLGDPDDPANWRASTQVNGTPGSAGAPPPPSSVRLNEVLAANVSAVNNAGTYPDFVELYNSGASPLNLAGWSLSDDGDARKFVFPSTTIPAGGYLSVWCDDTTNTSPGLHAGFAIDPQGDSLFLYDASTNRVDAVSLGLQLPDYAVGRVGAAWVLTTPTLNGTNVAAPVASATNLTINEWLANPLPGGEDWIELYNRATLPVALRGVYLGTTGAVHRITSLSFIGPLGFAQFLADEGVGARHLDFHLAAIGDSVLLADVTGVEVERVAYTNALPGITRGRLPDGSGSFVNFQPPGSPATNNYVAAYSGAILNEVLVRNRGSVLYLGRSPGFIELLNTNASPANLAGMSLSVDDIEPGQWTFPPGASLAPGDLVVIWCDGGRPASTLAGDYNIGRGLDAASGAVYLFNTGGQLVNSVEYGFQLADRPIGLSGGQWRLLASPTAGTANAAPATLGTNSLLRVNEWMANSIDGPDWFELFNATNLPVALSGLILTDDPSVAGLTQFRGAPLSFIDSLGFVKWIADGQPGDGRQHVSFSLDDQGDAIHLYGTNGTNFILIDSVAFGLQSPGISQGRLPDGAAGMASFPGSASPAEANYLLQPDVVINEILTHAAPGSFMEDAVELRDTGTNFLNLGGWFLSDSQDNFKKYRIPDGTTIAPGGFKVFYEAQFNSGPAPFHFDAAHGGEIWLSAADAGGNLTGYRTGARFDAAAANTAFGRFTTTLGIDYPALASRTFGADTPGSLAEFRAGTGRTNSAPLIGPVILNELMYHPPTSSSGSEDEYIELLNVSGAPVPLFDPAHPTNTWRIDGVDFRFPTNITLAAGAFALVVNFDPADSVALEVFRLLYGVPQAVTVVGPYTGHLDNGGETLELLRPDAPLTPPAPDAGFVPYVRVDRVSFGDSAPWPSGGVDGAGLSLQRKTPSSYGNEPLNWIGALPTAGAANTMTVVPPTVTASPLSMSVFEGTSPMLTATGAGTGPLTYQWRFNGTTLAGATNNTMSLDFATVENSGTYDVIVSNPGGSALSQPAQLLVLAPPMLLLAPVSQLVSTGATVTFTALVRATPPITYQWRLNGVTLPGETGPTIVRTNVTLADDGVYELLITSPAGMLIASATLGIKILPVIVVAPISQTVVAGGNASFSAATTGNPAPYTFSWRRITPAVVVAQTVANLRSNFVTFNVTTAGFVLSNGITVSNFACRLVVSNAASFPGQGFAASFTLTVVADTDSDGVPDVWSQQYFLHPTGQVGDLSRATDDFDHDGMSNRDEYIAGTDPTDPLSFLSVALSAGPSSAVVSFGAISNRTYSVQFTDAPGQSPWLPLVDVLARTTNRIELIPDAAWTPHRFYRVATPRQP